ncbi:unnamed protein product [Spirodela intermedia]|uniref:ZF-HD dimerization-type domain-containing protein n=1 Tax=Spirodela intermedia TaxID=51605 RepID=A0A7I8J3G8_SPIIN|nr:unnamed protein product [Spirodela intermedia]CAA6664343.1 unnamed protein product [Spirodela intermedia]
MDFDDHDNPEQIGGGGADSSAAAVAGTSGSWRAATGAGSGSGGGGVRYRECLKNHAVNIGGHAVDGCGEFMPAGEEGTMDALKCAACNCHRNFHRKEIEGQQLSPYYRFPASGYLQMAAPGAAVQMRPLALPSTSGRGGTHSRDQDDMSTPMVSGGGGGGGGAPPQGEEKERRDFGPSLRKSRRKRCWLLRRRWGGESRSTTRRRFNSSVRRPPSSAMYSRCGCTTTSTPSVRSLRRLSPDQHLSLPPLPLPLPPSP